jgi:hypothetical protein
VLKRKLVTNLRKHSYFNKGYDLHCSIVAKQDFDPVGVLDRKKNELDINHIKLTYHG